VHCGLGVRIKCSDFEFGGFACKPTNWNHCCRVQKLIVVANHDDISVTSYCVSNSGWDKFDQGFDVGTGFGGLQEHFLE